MNNRIQRAQRALGFRVVAILVVLYWMMQTVVGYIKGGPEAPTLGVLIASVVVLGGGAVLVGVMAWKAWKAELRLAELEAEEAAEAPAELEEAEEE